MRRGCTVGTFDGVHRGHALLIGVLRDLCRERHLQPTVVTFDRHPLEVVAPERAPLRLLTPERQEELLSELLDKESRVVVVPFTAELSSLSARDWIRRLRDSLEVDLIMLGYDNRFGHDGRSLTQDDLRRIGAEEGVEIAVAPQLRGVSSSVARRALEEGDVAGCREVLGRAPELEGRVVRGQQLGRSIGFPTANLEVGERILIPRNGVYAARALILPDREGEAAQSWPAMLNIGSRPTLGEGLPPTIEAHLIGFNGDLYGKRVRLELLGTLRDERGFPSLEDLKRQLERDREQTLDFFSKI